MFILFATAPLNDDTKGFRFNFAGFKGLTRKRISKSRGWKIEAGKCTNIIHLGKRTIYFEKKANRLTNRKLAHFAR